MIGFQCWLVTGQSMGRPKDSKQALLAKVAIAEILDDLSHPHPFESHPHGDFPTHYMEIQQAPLPG
jgi:hypothetical protein